MSSSSVLNRVSRKKNHLFQRIFPIQTCYLRTWDERGMNTLPVSLGWTCLSWGGGSWRGSGDRPGHSILLLDRLLWVKWVWASVTGETQVTKGWMCTSVEAETFCVLKSLSVFSSCIGWPNRVCCTNITNTHPHCMRWIKMVSTRLRMAFTKAVTPFQPESSLRSLIKYPSSQAGSKTGFWAMMA